MPLGKIVLIKRTPEEQAVWEKVSKLLYPERLDALKRLSKADFYVWFAALDPYAALVLTNDQAFYDLVFYQRHKRWYHEVVDYIRRKFHGDY